MVKQMAIKLLLCEVYKLRRKKMTSYIKIENGFYAQGKQFPPQDNPPQKDMPNPDLPPDEDGA